MLSKTIFMLKLINVGNKRREPMLRLMLIFFSSEQSISWVKIPKLWASYNDTPNF